MVDLDELLVSLCLIIYLFLPWKPLDWPSPSQMFSRDCPHIHGFGGFFLFHGNCTRQSWERLCWRLCEKRFNSTIHKAISLMAPSRFMAFRLWLVQFLWNGKMSMGCGWEPLAVTLCGDCRQSGGLVNSAVKFTVENNRRVSTLYTLELFLNVSRNSVNSLH